MCATSHSTAPESSAKRGASRWAIRGRAPLVRSSASTRSARGRTPAQPARGQRQRKRRLVLLACTGRIEQHLQHQRRRESPAVIEMLPAQQPGGLETGLRIEITPHDRRHPVRIALSHGLVKHLTRRGAELQVILLNCLGRQPADQPPRVRLDAVVILLFAIALIEDSPASHPESRRARQRRRPGARR